MKILAISLLLIFSFSTNARTLEYPSRNMKVQYFYSGKTWEFNIMYLNSPDESKEIKFIDYEIKRRGKLTWKLLCSTDGFIYSNQSFPCRFEEKKDRFKVKRTIHFYNEKKETDIFYFHKGELD